MTRRRAAVYALAGLAAIGLGIGGGVLARRAAESSPVPALPIATRGGALMLCGGADLPEEIRRKFLELAGGSRASVVVIPSGHPDADTPEADSIYLKPFRDLGAASVVMLHTHDRARADDPKFVAPLREATGVWIGGGLQSNLKATFGGTELERGVRAVLRRGGVVAGTSAGATILGDAMFLNNQGGPEMGRGFGVLKDTLIDQHFLRRRHLGRLVRTIRAHPEWLGIGIDEGTALLLRAGRLTVVGDGNVVLVLPSPDGPEVENIRRGDEADWASLRGPEPRIIRGFEIEPTEMDDR